MEDKIHTTTQNTVDTITEPAPIDTNKTTPPTVSPPGKKRRKKNMLIIVAVTIVIALAVALGVWFAISKNTATKNEKANDPAAATHFDSSDALVTKAVVNLSGAEVNTTTFDGLGGRTADGYITYNTATYKHDNASPFSNLPLESTGAGYKGDSQTAGADYAKLQTFFKDNKFVLRNSDENFSANITLDGQNATTIKQAVYVSTDKVCLIQHVDASETSIDDHLASVGCGNTSSYVNAAKAMKPLYDAYTKSSKNPSPYIVLGLISTGKGLDGYEYAMLYQENPEEIEGSFKGAYYKQSTQGDWTYLKSFTSQLTCSDINTDALKQAFSGLTCLDASQKQSAIRL